VRSYLNLNEESHLIDSEYISTGPRLPNTEYSDFSEEYQLNSKSSSS